MKISVVIKPNSRRPGVEQCADGSYRVAVKAPPVEGKANEELIEKLAKHFGVPKSAIQIIHGAKGRNKILYIDNASIRK